MKSNGTIYWYGTNSAPIYETNVSNKELYGYLFLNGQRAARHSPDNHVIFYITDALGSTRYLWDVGGLPATQIDYYPFGGERDYSSGPVTPYKFTGKERDSESGLDNFGARYNSSSMGRFMSPDLMGGHQEDPQTLNKYVYVRNNPLNITDPTGLDLYLKGCGDNSATCHDNYVGTTDDTSKFTRTTIQSDENGDFDGHDVNFNSSGIHIDGKYQGEYVKGSAATRVNGDDDSGFAGTHFVVNSNCLGDCLAGGALYSDSGNASVFKGVIATLEGPNKGLDSWGDHPGEQYRGGNESGPDAHLSYITDQNGLPFHIDNRNPFHSVGGFAQHTGDLISSKWKAIVLRQQGPPLPPDIRPQEKKP